MDGSLIFWAKSLKLVSAIFFIKLLFFHQMIAIQKLKIFLFDLRSSFRSRDIQIFVYSSSPLFFPVSHCFRSWFKKNIKVYDVIYCLNKNLTHFVWYLEKEISYDIETLSIDRVLNTEHFYEKIMQKMCTPKASPRPLFILLNNPKQPLHARNFFKISYFERGLSKSLKKVNFIISFKPSSF